MRKRNRKVNRHSRFTINTAGVVAVLMMGFTCAHSRIVA
jgi:hypothetical protein